MRFTLTLSCGWSKEFSKDQFIETYPGSMISAALDNSEATNITLHQPCVTKEVIEVLYAMVQTPTYPQISPMTDTSTFKEAARYLLIDILEVIGDPAYRLFQIVYKNELLGPEPRLIDYAIDTNYLSLLKYVLGSIGSIGKKCDLDDHFHQGVIRNRVEMVGILLSQYGVNPHTAVHSERIDEFTNCTYDQALYRACDFGYFEMVQRLLQDPRTEVHHSGESFNALTIAMSRGWFHIAHLILSDPRCRPKDQNIGYFKYGCDIRIINLLLSHPDMDPNDPELLGMIQLIDDPSDICHLLLNDPRLDEDYMMACTAQMIELEDTEYFPKLLENERVTGIARDAVQLAMKDDYPGALRLLGRR